MKKNFKNKIFLITGGTGFLGQSLIKKLKSIGCKNLYVASHKNII